MQLRTIKVNEADATKRQLWFDLRLESDGITPVLTEAGEQPQISIAGAGWTDVGIGVLVHVGNGRYYATLDSSSVSVVDVSIESRYKGTLTAETPGDSAAISEFDLSDIAASQDEILTKLDAHISNEAAEGSTTPSTGSASNSSVDEFQYVSLSVAQSYFDTRLHEIAWTDASPGDREKSLLAASRIIDRLNFKGQKKTVYDVYTANNQATQLELNAASQEQALQFPRDTDTEIPEEIKIACLEIAYALLDGIDPDLELENLAIVSHGYASVRTTFARTQNPQEHLNAGVPSATAWRYLKPFLREPGGIILSRVN